MAERVGANPIPVVNPLSRENFREPQPISDTMLCTLSLLLGQRAEATAPPSGRVVISAGSMLRDSNCSGFECYETRNVCPIDVSGLPPEYWKAILRYPCVDADAGWPRELQLDQISKQILRVGHRPRGRTVERSRRSMPSEHTACRPPGRMSARGCSTIRAVSGLGVTKRTAAGRFSNTATSLYL